MYRCGMKSSTAPDPIAAAVLSIAPATTFTSGDNPSAAATSGFRLPRTVVHETISGNLSASMPLTLDQRVVVADVVGVAVVRHPGREDRVESGGEAPGQAQVKVIEHVEEFVRALVDLRESLAHQQHVPGRVFAGRSRACRPSAGSSAASLAALAPMMLIGPRTCCCRYGAPRMSIHRMQFISALPSRSTGTVPSPCVEQQTALMAVLGARSRRSGAARLRGTPATILPAIALRRHRQ